MSEPIHAIVDECILGEPEILPSEESDTLAPDPGDVYKEAVWEAEQHFGEGIAALLKLGRTVEQIRAAFEHELNHDRTVNPNAGF